MFVNTNQIQSGLYNFIDREIGSKAVDMQKFAIYFLLPIIIKKAADYVNSFKDNEFTKDFFNSNGDVDLDECYVDFSNYKEFCDNVEKYLNDNEKCCDIRIDDIKQIYEERLNEQKEMILNIKHYTLNLQDGVINLDSLRK